jgi:hypothetical protein
MVSALSITSAVPDSQLLDLPWNLPLELWPDETIATLPKGISRHLVRFVHLGGYVVAIKETSAKLARREYELLRTLQRLDIPCVVPVAVITDRVADDGEELAPALVTRHLRFSLPYRALYSQTLRPDTATRLVDALAVLLARLHIVGFFWGDVSLSNTLFRRDAGEFAAYLVDAETGVLHDGGLSEGQREHLEIGRINIAGELLDLQAGGRLDDFVDRLCALDMTRRSRKPAPLSPAAIAIHDHGHMPGHAGTGFLDAAHGTHARACSDFHDVVFFLGGQPIDLLYGSIGQSLDGLLTTTSLVCRQGLVLFLGLDGRQGITANIAHGHPGPLGFGANQPSQLGTALFRKRG